jgi:thioredoxin-dependent peroxiredoxin
MKPGQPAPDFDAIDQHGTRHRLADYRGRWLAIYFYPRDGTPGCTKQACSLRDQRAVMDEHALAVLGVSAQSSAAHRAFSDRHRLDFPLLIDPAMDIARAYGALGSGLTGRLRSALGLYRRITCLVDPSGRVVQLIDHPDVRRHGEELVALLPHS